MATVNNFKETKSIEDMIKIFRRECDSEAILSEMKKRKYFMKDSRIKHELRKKTEHKTKVDNKKISERNKRKF